MDCREPHIPIEHRFDVGDEDHRDVGDRLGLAGEARLVLQAVVFLVWDLEGDVGGTDFISATRLVRSVTNLNITVSNAGFGPQYPGFAFSRRNALRWKASTL